MMFRKLLFLFLVVFLSLSVVDAQNDSDDACPVMVQTVLETVTQSCSSLSRNEACYGNNRVDVTFWESGDGLSFSQPADRVPLSSIHTLATAPLNLDSELWGVAVLSIQANLPDTLPGQAVTFVLMGDVSVENAVMPDEALTITPVDATVISGANLRSAPTTNANVIGAASGGQEIVLVGVNATGDWYEIARETGDTAWIFGVLVEVTDTDGLAGLPVTDGSGDEARYRPMQAFYFRTGIGQDECREAPDTLMIQSPGSRPVNLRINDLNVTVGSTVLFTSTTLEDGTVVLVGTLLEGTMLAYYEAFTLELTEPGQSFAVTLNEEGLVDEASEVVDITGNTAIENDVASGCQTLAASPIWGADIPPCEDLTINYDFPEPEPPSDGDLSDVGDGDACTVAALNTANLRGGPGTNYSWSGQLAQNEREYPVGYANGSDGFLWWQLSSGLWIRSDLVNQAGACDSVPSVVPPDPPTPAPSSSGGGGGGGGRQYEIALSCAEMNGIRAGQSVTFQVGIGRWESPDATNAALAGHSASFAIDGIGLSTYYEGPTLHTGAGAPDGWGNRARANWVATSGTHTIVGGWTMNGYVSCTFTVQ